MTALATAPLEIVAPIRVLIVDDFAASAFAMASALRRRGWLCDCAGTPSDALAAATRFVPELVLLEWTLGRGAGVGLARQLRAAVRGRRLVIVAVTTQDEPSGFREREQVDGYIVKPANIGELAGHFATLVRRSVMAPVRAIPDTTATDDKVGTEPRETACGSGERSTMLDKKASC